ncbi:kinase-like domain-containing protein, partial [Haematococcus lacustris]
VLDTAADLAKACIHMHRHGVLHSDIKARNVLLRGSGGSVGRGVTAKIADFGLAVKLPPGESCINNLFQGTITHMAPEVLKDGCISKQSDVYAFGITLW